MPIWPFHTWLPDAHTQAPTAGSMILAGVLLKLGAYGFIRLVIPLFPAQAQVTAGVLAILGMLSIVLGAYAAFGQWDFKRLVAYSSINHMGFVVLGIAVMAYAYGLPGREPGLSYDAIIATNGAVMQMFNHGLSAAGMFFLAEFINTLFWSGMFVTIFLGGYRFFGLENWVSADGYPYGRLIGLIAFFAKTFFMYFVYDWVRSTLPRVRVDQILGFNWKFLVPVSLVLLFFTAIVDKLIPTGTNAILRTAIHLLLNLVIAAGTLELLRRRGRQNRLVSTGGSGTGGARVYPHDGHGGDHGAPESIDDVPDVLDAPLGAREPVAVPAH